MRPQDTTSRTSRCVMRQYAAVSGTAGRRTAVITQCGRQLAGGEVGTVLWGGRTERLVDKRLYLPEEWTGDT